MRLVELMCLGGTEIANGRRSLTYAQQGVGDARFSGYPDCTCDALEEVPFVGIVDDPAPWYDANVSASEEFLGLYAHTIRLLSPLGRDVNRRRGAGGVLSPLGLTHRVIIVQGTLFAASARGMYYGERWLTEVLKGSLCQGGCASDELVILPACPPTGEAADSHLRTLFNVGVIDGPEWVPIQELPECVIQEVRFQLAAGMPYLYAPPETCLNETTVAGTTDCCLSSTNSWPGDATLRITLTAGDTEATDITVTGTVSVNDTCPPSGGAEDIPPCFVYTIPSIPPNASLVIDGTRQQVVLEDPISRSKLAGFPFLDVVGLFNWPDIGLCTDLCTCIANAGAEDITVLVEKFDREL